MGAGGTAAAASNGRGARRRHGNAMSDKQLARTVLDGRKITVVTVAREVTGYLCGMDDFTYMVISPEGRKSLVHKTGSVIELDDDCTYADEPKHDILESVVGPFRAHLIASQQVPNRVTREAV